VSAAPTPTRTPAPVQQRRLPTQMKCGSIEYLAEGVLHHAIIT
jgi:hypothetical protein